MSDINDDFQKFDREAGFDKAPVKQVMITGTAALLVEKDQEIERLRAELEVERQRLAACGVAALGYFTGCKDEYRSASLEDVLRLRAENATLKVENECLGASCKACGEQLTTLREALRNHGEEAAKMVNAEPVAWYSPVHTTKSTGCVHIGNLYSDTPIDGYIPLYTSPAIPEGWVMVPKEPPQSVIEAMHDACLYEDQLDLGVFKIAYKAMIAAAHKRSQQAAPTSSTKENDV